MKRFAILAWPGVWTTGLAAWVLTYHGIVNAPPEPDLFAWVCIGLIWSGSAVTVLGVLGRIDQERNPT